MNSQIPLIIVLYHTPSQEIDRLNKESREFDLQPFFIDNTKTGVGYAAGVNQGINKVLKSHPQYIFIANPDISLKTLHKEHMLEVMKHFDIGGYTMKQQEKMYYGGELDRWRMSGGLITSKPDQRFASCDFVSGSLMVIKPQVIDRLGLFDESYGMYYEDVDYCLRAKQAGFKVGIDSEQIYKHFEESKKNPLKNSYLAKNRRKILWKYGTWQQKLYELIRLPKTLFEILFKF